jgi:hypothetical protein
MNRLLCPRKLLSTFRPPLTPRAASSPPIYLGTEGAGAIRKDGWYTLLMAETRKGTQLALDEEVQPVTTAGGEDTFAQLGKRKHCAL